MSNQTNNSSVYDVDYFIEKFEKIPEEMWWTKAYGEKEDGPHCAYGHCGMNSKVAGTPESSALFAIFTKTPYNVVSVNDGGEVAYPQTTPKQRVLALLKDFKAGRI